MLAPILKNTKHHADPAKQARRRPKNLGERGVRKPVAGPTVRLRQESAQWGLSLCTVPLDPRKVQLRGPSPPLLPPTIHVMRQTLSQKEKRMRDSGENEHSQM